MSLEKKLPILVKQWSYFTVERTLIIKELIGNLEIDNNGDVVSIYDVWTVGEDGTTEITDKISRTDVTKDLKTRYLRYFALKNK
jgi:hypothetical protein